MLERSSVEQPAGADVLVIETETETFHVRPVRGCPGVYTVIAGERVCGGFRCDDPSERAIRDEAELVIEESRAAAEV